MMGKLCSPGKNIDLKFLVADFLLKILLVNIGPEERKIK